MTTNDIIFMVLNLAGALAVFLFAMKLMSEGLQKFAGSKLRHILTKITGKPLSGILSGAAVTAAIQSSSATTVMVVGFTEAGLLSLSGAIAVVMGANIGTTITAWIISLFGLGGGSGLFSLPLLLAAISLFFIFSKKSSLQSLGQSIIGLALLLIGMGFLQSSFPNLTDYPEFLHSLSLWSGWGYASILIFVLIGTIITGVIQASAAMTAIILLMGYNGWIGFDMAMALIMGQNIGTTMTAQIAAMTTGKTGKRAARAHLVFNVAGVILCLIVFYPLLHLIENMTAAMPFFSQIMGGIMPAQITLFHTLFNVGTTLILAFFIPQLARLVEWLVPENKEEGEEEFRLTYIEPNMISTAELNLQSAKNEIEEFSKRVLRMYTFLPGLRTAKDDEEFDAIMERIIKYEGITDRMEMEIANFLTKVGSGDISAHASKRITSMMRIIDNLESIGDAIYQIAMTRKNKREDAVHFDQGLNDNLQHMSDLVQHALDVMDANLHDYDHVNLDEAYAAERDINAYRDVLRTRHLDALKLGVYNFGIGNAYSSLYALYEKLGDYVINVSEAIDNSVKAAETLGTDNNK